jgi:hypothetical protein
LLSIVFALLVQAVPAEAPETSAAADTGAEVQPADAAPDAPAEPAPPPALVLPKAHPIVISVDAELGSKISVTGQMFPISLAQAVVVEGIELLPAGIKGEGQVVHAKKAGLAGAAGELVLAARYLEHNGRRIELRSFRFMEAGESSLGKGQDNTGVSNVTTALAGPIGFFIGGGNTNVMPGTIASAKFRNEETFVRPAAAPADQQVTQQEDMP